MILINRNIIPTPSVFETDKLFIASEKLSEFYNRSEFSRSQERYQQPFSIEISREILDALKVVFNNKCAYCESQISPNSKEEIDHFRPKSGARGLNDEFARDHYWWLTYEWRNLYLSCQVCNRYKSTWFPVEGPRAAIKEDYEVVKYGERALLIDPCFIAPEEHLLFKPDGTVDFLSQVGRVTIEILKLNREELISARNEALRDTYSTWEEFLHKWRNREGNWSRIQEIGREWADIFGPDSKVSHLGAKRQLLLDRFSVHSDINNFFRDKMYDYTYETRTLSFEGVGIVLEKIAPSKELEFEQRKIIEESIDLKKLKHVYLDSIELNNYKCFSQLRIKFGDGVYSLETNNPTEGTSNSQPWLLFLGENGVGKSSLLKAISIALMSRKYRKEIEEHIKPEMLLKHDATSGYIRLYLKGEAKPIEVKFNNESKKLICTNTQAITNLIGYGSVRLLPNKKIQSEKIKNDVIKTKNLFDYSVALEDANNWLLQLNDTQFDNAASTLKKLMSLDNDSKLQRNAHEKPEKSISVISRNGRVSYVDQLSDGYKSVYSLAVDIMSTLSNESVFYEVCEAIVLIDEIGTHLHPRWKMEVVSQLREAFPRIQFIVTTHEPLCLRGLNAGETVVLTQEENDILAVTDLPDPSTLRIDQILTSDFFGLRSTLDPKTENDFNEYYEILALNEQDRSERQKSRLLELSQILPRIKHLGDTLREDLVYYVIDELLAKQVKNDGLNIKEELQQSALNRVRSLWESLDKNKDFK